MIKILFFIPGLSEGGAEKVLRSLVNNMDQSEFDITVHTIAEEQPEKYLVPGIHYKAINRCKNPLFRKIFQYWIRLCAELKVLYPLYIKDDYDIEVAYLETAATKIIAQSTNKNAKKLAWVHCDLSKKEGMEKVVDKVRRQYKQYDKIVCVSEDVRSGFYKLLGQDFNTVVVNNVIDDAEINIKAKEPIDCQANSDEVQLMAVGRLSPEKNYEHLIMTCGKLKREGIRFHLNILGGGPEKDHLFQIIHDLKLDQNITLKGHVDNPYPWMKKADIIICSSKYEGLSTVIQEAMILGKAIITTPCGGMRDLLGESEYGMIIDFSEDGLYKGLYRMIDSEDLRCFYSKKAKERSRLFSKTAVIGATQELFKNMLR